MITIDMTEVSGSLLSAVTVKQTGPGELYCIGIAEDRQVDLGPTLVGRDGSISSLFDAQEAGRWLDRSSLTDLFAKLRVFVSPVEGRS
ncbi:hypothetical protein [Glycomyces xiaoerkulensis]|uniref:hypothetical protein n=1 Tax=Glycomyces xiaoerkulensis TaxID=2038139 RepID=UPI0018E4C6CD|nr:hypothetical protein [Glycomyces xiaoerkulensis]